MVSSVSTEAVTKAFGQIVLAYRTTRKITRPQLAEAMGLSVQTIQGLETAEKGGFHISSFLKFAAVLDKSPTDLMDDVVAQAGIVKGTLRGDDALKHAIDNYLSPESKAVLLKSAHGNFDKDLNQLAWALEIGAELLQLEERDREEFELAIRRKSPQRKTQKSRARIRELLEKTTFDGLD